MTTNKGSLSEWFCEKMENDDDEKAHSLFQSAVEFLLGSFVMGSEMSLEDLSKVAHCFLEV